MAPKSNKGKGVASSSQGTKRSIFGEEAQTMDASMPQQLSRRYGLYWVIDQEATDEQLNIDYPLYEHSRAFCNVRPGFEEPFDDNNAIYDE
ncbi:hypothetical protein HAX54_036411 [Datura stramonium]|uniref:Uncharacterized protein n=1 Tax=Datura stramonium TaxID=4076 RepID=A0ABS8VKP0_DATST|nr:hypothetical protein [Datura stramonium]